MKAIGDAVELLVIDPPTQHLQALAMAGFVGIKLRGAVQRLARLPVLSCRIVELEKLDQSAAVFVLAIGGVKEFDQVFGEAKRTQPAVRHLIHAGDELAPPSRYGLMLFKF